VALDSVRYSINALKSGVYFKVYRNLTFFLSFFVKSKYESIYSAKDS
jgi:hypothetical protein